MFIEIKSLVYEWSSFNSPKEANGNTTRRRITSPEWALRQTTCELCTPATP